MTADRLRYMTILQLSFRQKYAVTMLKFKKMLLILSSYQSLS